jgi:hypothetical protein
MSSVEILLAYSLLDDLGQKTKHSVKGLWLNISGAAVPHK